MTDEWLVPPEPLTLRQDEVHVWRFGLSWPTAKIAALERTLAEDELLRAERYRFEKDRNRFIAARALLRTILARYLGASSYELRFESSLFGKPKLTRDSLYEDTRFNLSHSSNLALLAVARAREVGVDLEMIRPGLTEGAIPEKFFSPLEVEMLRALPKEQQTEAFFNCWTRKEAYIKARGEGLSIPLHLFDVTLAPGEKAALIDIRKEPQEARRWSLRELSPAPGFVGAVAAEGEDWRLKCWDFIESQNL
jgi:4'-phosphopantetheinyl transferase